MTIYNVERKVDTVILEMDISVAEQLVEVLDLVQDNTRKAESYLGSDLNALRVAMRENADVRFPSPLYKAHVRPIGYVELTDAL